MRTRVLALTAVVLAGTFGVLQGTGPAVASIDPANFTSPVPNPYFPLKPGTVYLYHGSEDGQRLIERLHVTHKTRTIEGVETIVVHDVIHADGYLEEDTTDWYANDNDGTTWYFGERTATYKPNGQLDSRDGSWLAGSNGGVAGIIMPADPHPTDAYRQELRPGKAEDQAWIVTRHEKVDIRLGRFDQVVRTFEWTRLEPGVVSVKLYAPHVGIVVEKDVAGGTESLRLVDMRRPA